MKSTMVCTYSHSEDFCGLETLSTMVMVVGIGGGVGGALGEALPCLGENVADEFLIGVDPQFDGVDWLLE